jgi:virginiamycin B lyase
MRRLPLLIALLGLLLLPTAAAAGPNVVGQVEEFPLGAGTWPEAIVTGPDGNLWFAGEKYVSGGFADVVGKVTLDGKVTEFQVDTHSANLGLSDIAAGSGSGLWFTEGGRPKVGRITLAGEITEFALPRENAAAARIVAGPEGDLWFTEEGTNSIGWMSPNGKLTEHSLVNGDQGLFGIAVGPDGAAWVTEPRARRIARIARDGSGWSFPFIGSGYPLEIVAGPDAALWLSNGGKGVVDRVSPVNTVHEFQVPGMQQTRALSNGPLGDIWYSNGAGQIGSLTPSGETAEPACIGSCGQGITALTEGPDGKLWFAAGPDPGNPISSSGVVGTFAPPPVEARIESKPELLGRRVRFQIGCERGAAGERCDGKLRLAGKTGASNRMHLLVERRLRLALGAKHVFFVRLPESALRCLVTRGRLVIRLSTYAGHGARDVRRFVLTE